MSDLNSMLEILKSNFKRERAARTHGMCDQEGEGLMYLFSDNNGCPLACFLHLCYVEDEAVYAYRCMSCNGYVTKLYCP